MLFSKTKETDQETGQIDKLSELVEEIGNRSLAYQDRTDAILARLLDHLETGQDKPSRSFDEMHDERQAFEVDQENKQSTDQ